MLATCSWVPMWSQVNRIVSDISRSMALRLAEFMAVNTISVSKMQARTEMEQKDSTMRYSR